MPWLKSVGMIKSEVIRVGQVRETAMYFGKLKDVASVDKSQIDLSNITNSGRVEHVDAHNVNVSELSESNVQLRSDSNNDLVVTPLVADSKVVDKLADLGNDEVTIDESQFDMGPQKGCNNEMKLQTVLLKITRAFSL